MLNQGIPILKEPAGTNDAWVDISRLLSFEYTDGLLAVRGRVCELWVQQSRLAPRSPEIGL